MFLPSLKIAPAIVLLAQVVSGLCLTEYSSMQAGAPPTPPPAAAATPSKKDAENQDAKKSIERSPLGFGHDFGKVEKGTIAKHTLRFVNVSASPLRITSLRPGSSTLTARSTKDVIEPYEEGALEIALDARMFTGRKTISLYLQTENGQPQETIFSITADAQYPQP